MFASLCVPTVIRVVKRPIHTLTPQKIVLLTLTQLDLLEVFTFTDILIIYILLPVEKL